MFFQRHVEFFSTCSDCPVGLSFSKTKFVFECIENIVEVRILCCESDSSSLPDR